MGQVQTFPYSPRRRLRVSSLLGRLLAMAALLICLAIPAAAQDVITVRPQDTGQALVNPDMGWVLYFYSNEPLNYGSKLEPSDTVDDFPGLSTVYLRVPGAFLEPEEGRFNWALFDTPAQRWIAKGKRFALRVTCSENWMRYATPEWVKQAGAKGTFYDLGQGPTPTGKSWDPDFGDPVFLEKLDHFLSAMAARYDDNPNVAFIDIGSYGLWGEGHTLMSSQVPEARARGIIMKHIDLYTRRFRHTRLAANDDMAGHDKPGAHFPETDYALFRGVTLRDGSIMVQPPPHSWYHAEMAQAFWPRLPVIVEHEYYGESKAKGAWGDGSLLLKAVEDYHASYLSIHGWPRLELNENRVLIDRINLRLGYRLQLREMSWPGEVEIGHAFRVRAVWANAGVAPSYPGGSVTLTLKDNKGGMVSVLADEQFNVRDLPPGPAGSPPTRAVESEFVIGRIAPVTKPGRYAVYVSVGQRDGTPRIALPLAGDDGQHRYRLGTITLLGKQN
jgi:Domain of unknown function (DUF4832)/Beta-galactosidase